MSERLWFKSWEVRALTGLTERQLGYYAQTKLATPERLGGEHAYTWYGLFELRTIVALRAAGESIQQIRKYFPRLRKWLSEFSPALLAGSVLMVRPSADGFAAFLVQSEAYALDERCSGVEPFARVRFNALASAVVWVDGQKGRGITMKDVEVA